VKVETIGKTGKKSSRRPNKKVVESLIASGAFDHFGNRNEVMKEYYRCRNNKKEEVPEDRTDDEWMALEIEMMGLCLSREPLYKQYEDLINENKWCLISNSNTKKKVQVFGQIQSITPKTSRKGNSMDIVEMTDGLDSIKFFVFRTGRQLFLQNFREGTLGAVPLSRFDDDDSGDGMRFFDDRGECEPIKVKKSVPTISKKEESEDE
jgi:DNA polymerase III alpha subunit